MVQMDGHLTLDEFKEGMKLAIRGCDQIYELQREALIEKHKSDLKAKE
jgi:exosome complex component RRP41